METQAVTCLMLPTIFVIISSNSHYLIPVTFFSYKYQDLVVLAADFLDLLWWLVPGRQVLKDRTMQQGALHWTPALQGNSHNHCTLVYDAVHGTMCSAFCFRIMLRKSSAEHSRTLQHGHLLENKSEELNPQNITTLICCPVLFQLLMLSQGSWYLVEMSSSAKKGISSTAWNSFRNSLFEICELKNNIWPQTFPSPLHQT